MFFFLSKLCRHAFFDFFFYAPQGDVSFKGFPTVSHAPQAHHRA
jgi:hypothetical protein